MTAGAVGALSSLAGLPGPDVTPGTMPGWALVFRADDRRLVTVTGYTYDGSVVATLPANLAGGRYEVTVEGLTDEDYQRIRLPAGRRLTADLHLWWKDTGTGILADLTRAAGAGDLLGRGGETPPANSLVAVLRIDTVRRQAGERRVDTVISGRELVFARLGESVVRGGLCYESLEAAARGVARDAGVPLATYGLEQLKPAADEKHFADVRPGTSVEAMRVIAAQAQASLAQQGLPTAVIRDGRLHVGLWTRPGAGVRALPVKRLLDESGGLLAVTRGTDTAAPSDEPVAANARAAVTATCLGRPDLKPGDTVRIPLPPEDFPVLARTGPGLPLLSDIAARFGSAIETPDPSPCVVTGVTHKLSARQGFVTVVQASVLRDSQDTGWDPVPPKREETEPEHKPARGGVPADHATGAAGAVQAVATATARQNRGLDLLAGQVRTHPPSVGSLPPEQTSSGVWYSTAPDDGRPSAVRRRQVTPQRHGELPDVPVVTPFAFGGYGLVLPRYPGQRMVLADRGGGRDVVDLGSVWENDVTPPAQPGDWWLILPVGVSTDDLTPSQTAAPPKTGEACHDLTDLDGHRVVEVSSLTLRVPDKPSSSDQRPEPGRRGTVVVENAKARIVLHDDGSIEITGTAIKLDAGSGDITLNAKNVKVAVSGTMDVS